MFFVWQAGDSSPARSSRKNYRAIAPEMCFSLFHFCTNIQQLFIIPLGSSLQDKPMKKPLLLTVAFFIAACTAAAQDPLTAAQIVDHMERNNQARANDLKHFTSLRHYSVEYKGFPGNVSAAIDVELNFDAPSTKNFHIISQTGSKYICDHVLIKLVESETDASHNKRSTDLNHENYNFTLLGTENVNGRPAYIFKVEPITESKYLYRGKVWVDVAEFALVKIDAEPSKSPSFWISKTQIHHIYSKIGEFWLPETNRSETQVRIGGTAALTINYGNYAINNAPLSKPTQVASNGQ
jgi:hypothetical protein